jgi:hypothetical protein
LPTVVHAALLVVSQTARLLLFAQLLQDHQTAPVCSPYCIPVLLAHQTVNAEATLALADSVTE